MVSPPVRAQQQLSYIAIAALSDCRLLAVWHRPAARPAFLVPPLTEDTAGIAAMDLSLAVVDMLGVPQPVVLLTILIATLGALWFIISKRKSAAPRVVVRNAAEMRVAVSWRTRLWRWSSWTQRGCSTFLLAGTRRPSW
jgi:hypothetical protein